MDKANSVKIIDEFEKVDINNICDAKHCNHLKEEGGTEETRCPTYLRIEERICYKPNNNQIVISCVDGEKFDIHIAAESLRTYHRKLRLKKEESKAKERHVTSCRLRQSPSYMKRYEHLHEISKSKKISEKEGFYPKASSLTHPKSQSKENSLALNQICKRLYDQSVSMQMDGKKRRQDIDNARVIANPLPPQEPQSNRKNRNSGSMKSRDFLRRSSSRTSRSPLVSSNSYEPPTPQEIITRLYAPSLPMQEYGKERRDEINKMKTQFNRSMVTESREVGKSARKSRSSLVPQEIIDRLYAPSLPKQEHGKERRDEMSKTRAQFDRLTVTEPRVVGKSARKSRSSRVSSSPYESTKPQEITDRIYAPSLPMQESRKERRDKISKIRPQSI